eukprot:CAMPEP_0185736032 /NCGR_PEP_ID=MMETSP1171-20130828/26733_1 /TAXON_ID=374046 /ORGANISM="Helicotheca tamensis, Strain CCMP826" /LENGTH=55 /DNA_ID=CAMNT_0028406519 /DNA_START=54 /DNA_END=217 /DNA_ORIENTATION=+
MNAWAASALPSPDFLLALTVNEPSMNALKRKYDVSSSLATPHLTILNGFVEVNST